MRKCVAVLLLLMSMQSLGCGTLLFRERIGQPRGKLDIWVVLLDSIGLVYFVAPGLVAFAIDFGTGAIYLPRAADTAQSGASSSVEMQRLAARARDPRAIEQALREVSGVELAQRWDEVVLLQHCEPTESVSVRLLELDAQARREGSGAGLDPAAEPRAPAFRSCARR